jgi:hypothetical protein
MNGSDSSACAVSEAAPSAVIVTLSIAPMLEERIVDWLLERDDVASFTEHAIHSYGADIAALDVGEQVSGRQRRIELRVELLASVVDEWLAALRDGFGGVDVRYWVSPVVRSGHLHDSVG